MSIQTSEQENRQELRQRIVESAMKAFITEGIKSVTMDEVALGLGISKRTLYEVFSDKESLLMECLESFHQKRIKEIADIAENCSNAMEIILHFYDAKIKELRHTNPRFYRDIKKYRRVQEYMNTCQENAKQSTYNFFVRGVQEGYFRNDINLEIAIIVLREQIDSLLRTDVYNAYEMADVFNVMLLTAIRGISTPKGLVLVEEYFKNRKQTL